MNLIETKRLILREWEIEDVFDFYEYASDPIVCAIMGYQPLSDIEEALKVVKDFIYHKEVYAVVLKEENKVIGSIGLHPHACSIRHIHLDKDIEFVLNKGYWGSGYMTEAASGILTFCFEHIHVDNLYVNLMNENARSMRFIKGLGFHLMHENQLYNEVKTQGLIYVKSKNENA